MKVYIYSNFDYESGVSTIIAVFKNKNDAIERMAADEESGLSSDDYMYSIDDHEVIE